VKRWRPIIFNNTQTRADSGSGQQILAATTIRQHIGNKFLFLVMIVLFANATGCSYLRGTLPDGKIAVEVVSSKLAKKLAEPDAGLSGRKVTILNPADQSVVASGTTDSSGLLDFDLAPGTYTLVGMGDGPTPVQVLAGQTESFKLVVH
jgi:hypothetical protein